MGLLAWFRRRRAQKEMAFTSRYDVLPMNPKATAHECEGTGWIPVYMAAGDRESHRAQFVRGPSETNPELVKRWMAAEHERPSLDGWHFVRCPDCEHVSA